ncbi:MAG: glycosyltransferase family 2 protein [Lachnospiraceae bacterium]|nr:glycosyltransferase family 2 protein [Lachnospiraceae bacterium]
MENESIDHEVAVIILNYKTWQETLDEIRMMRQILDINCDFIVVDNCSPNDSYEHLKKNSKQLNYTLLNSDSNGGYAKGNNIGLRFAKEQGYRYGWIINNDILLAPDFSLRRLLDVFQQADDIAVVSPDVYSPDGRLFNRDSKRWTFWNLTFGMMQYKKDGRDIEDQGGWGYIYRPQGCSMILDIKKCSEVGFMDEHTFLYCEEPILAERLLNKGFRSACNTTNKIIHNHSYTVHSAMDRKKIIATNLASFNYYLTEYRRFKGIRLGLCMWFQKIKLLYIER